MSAKDNPPVVDRAAADPSPCPRCDGDGKAHGADRPFEWSGPGSYPGPCPACLGSGLDPGKGVAHS